MDCAHRMNIYLLDITLKMSFIHMDENCLFRNVQLRQIIFTKIKLFSYLMKNKE